MEERSQKREGMEERRRGCHREFKIQYLPFDPAPLDILQSLYFLGVQCLLVFPKKRYPNRYPK